jgi:thioredoxin-like negative regulator of GroEL
MRAAAGCGMETGIQQDQTRRTMEFEVYGKAQCAKCASTKDKLAHLIQRAEMAGQVGLSFVNVDTVQGMADGAFHDVHEVPTTILRSENGEPIARWDARIPPAAEIKAFLAKVPPVSAP